MKFVKFLKQKDILLPYLFIGLLDLNYLFSEFIIEVILFLKSLKELLMLKQAFFLIIIQNWP